MLKVFMLLFLFSTVLAEKTPREKFHEADEKCQREHHVTHVEMNELYGEISGDTDKIDRKYKCFIKCILDEINIKDESGKIDFKQVAQVFYPTDTNTQEMTAGCAARYVSETDECERQFKTFVCIAINLKKEQEKSRKLG